jgi:hypothetical protein
VVSTGEWKNKTGFMTKIDDFFAGQERSRQIYETLRQAIESIGPIEIRVMKSQITFRNDRAFAWAWIPARYLNAKSAPLVLTISLRRNDQSPRWKEVVEPYPGRFTHHLELYSTNDIDEQVRNWLQEAWITACDK